MNGLIAGSFGCEEQFKRQLATRLGRVAKEATPAETIAEARIVVNLSDGVRLPAW